MTMPMMPQESSQPGRHADCRSTWSSRHRRSPQRNDRRHVEAAVECGHRVFGVVCLYDGNTDDRGHQVDRMNDQREQNALDAEDGVERRTEIIAPTFSAAVDSKMSAPRPAQSPTLSPTRSAITAGLRGSSSGIPASTFPTRSAPTSAALV